MFFYIVLFLVFVPKCELLEPRTTIPIEERIEFLKNELKRKAQERHHLSLDQIKSYEDDDGQEYEERNKLEPILEKDERKTDGKFGLRKIKTTPTTASDEAVTARNYEMTPMDLTKQPLKSKKKFIDDKLDTYYRRSFDPELRKKPLKWIHCHDMVRPFMNCEKGRNSQITNITHENHDVNRLLHLIHMNTTGYTADDIYAIMLQLSNIKIKLFQWDTVPIRSVIDVIIQRHSLLDKSHNLANIKSGLKNIFTSWGLDIGNTTILLKAAKIFRPPCIPSLADRYASTKSQKRKIKQQGLMTTTPKKCLEGKKCLKS